MNEPPNTAQACRRPVLAGWGVDGIVAAGLAAVLTGGLWRPGYPLLRDMVATPHPPLGDAALGVDGSAARAVPQDVAVALGARLVNAVGLSDSSVIAALTTMFALWLALGASMLVRSLWPAAGASTRLPAMGVVVWNPWVVERLLQGHWSLLAGAAACVTIPAILLRTHPAAGDPRATGNRVSGGYTTMSWQAVAATAACISAAGITPTGWLLATLTTGVCLLARPGCSSGAPQLFAIAGASMATASPWVIATVLTGAATATLETANTGVAAFAARAETGVGTAGATAALGGIWNFHAVPGSRTTWWVVPALALWLAMWAAASTQLWSRRHTRLVATAAALAAVSWITVVAAATDVGLVVWQSLAQTIPGAGLLRDTHKFMALALPATALAAAAASRALTGSRGTPRSAVLAAVVVCGAAIASVPDAATELWHHTRPTHYGPGWAQVRHLTAEHPDMLLVLPAGQMRSTPLWAGGDTVLDPAPRMLDVPVATAGDLLVATPGDPNDPIVAGGEDRSDRQLYAHLLQGHPPTQLTSHGVRWVLDERSSAGPRGLSHRTLEAAHVRYRDTELVLYELPGPISAVTSVTTGDRAAVWAGHAAWILVLVASLAALIVRADRRGATATR